MPKLADYEREGQKILLCRGCEKEYFFADYGAPFSEARKKCRFHEMECEKLTGGYPQVSCLPIKKIH